MATMGLKLVSGDPDIRSYPEDTTSGSFAQGDMVYLYLGHVRLASSEDQIGGVAQKGYSGTAETAVPVSVVNPSQVWCIESDGTTTQVMEGTTRGLTLTYGAQCVEIADTTSTAVTIQKLDPRDGATTGAGGRLLIRFTPATCQLIGG